MSGMRRIPDPGWRCMALKRESAFPDSIFLAKRFFRQADGAAHQEESGDVPPCFGLFGTLFEVPVNGVAPMIFGFVFLRATFGHGEFFTAGVVDIIGANV